MEETTKKVSRFVRTLIVAFCILLVLMILYNYFCVTPKGDISLGIITLLLILLVLILSESFDQFAIGKLFSMSRDAKKKEVQVNKLEKEKSELFNQLINVTTSQNQTQQHISVSGDFNATPSKVGEIKTDSANAMGFTPSNPNVVTKGDKK
ncbi:MAG: hypothetical protein ACI86C_001767 [Candidatus Latescibacterota bacterium]